MSEPKKRSGYEIDTDKGVTWRDHVRFWLSGWRLKMVLALTCLAGILAWKGPDWYRQVKLERATTLLARAEEARARGDSVEGAKLLGQATALLGRHPITLRAVARYKAERHDLSALNTYAELATTDEATVEDKVAFARTAFRLDQPSRASKVLDELISAPSTGQRPDVLALKAQRLATEGAWEEALAAARQAAGDASAPARPEESLVLALVLLHVPTGFANANERHAEAVEILGKLCQSKEPAALEAAAILIGETRAESGKSLLRGRDARAWVAAISGHPLAEAGLRVHAWSLRIAAQPENGAEIIKEFQAQFRDAPSSVRLEAARWLIQHGEHQLALELSEASKLQSEEWFTVYLDATAALNRWGQVQGLLGDPKNANLLPQVVRKLFQLRARLEANQKLDVAQEWRDIQRDLKHETTAIQLYVAGYAHLIHFSKEAAVIYRRLINDSGKELGGAVRLSRPQRLHCYTSLIRLDDGKGSAEDLRSIYVDFVKDFPELDEVRNDLAYLNLLTRQEIDGAWSTAQELTRKHPEMLAYRSTLALAELRKQNAKAAEEVYKGWNIDWSTALDRYKAVYVAVKMAVRDPVSAGNVRDKLNLSALRPEERELAGSPQGW